MLKLGRVIWSVWWWLDLLLRIWCWHFFQLSKMIRWYKCAVVTATHFQSIASESHSSKLYVLERWVLTLLSNDCCYCIAGVNLQILNPFFVENISSQSGDDRYWADTSEDDTPGIQVHTRGIHASTLILSFMAPSPLQDLFSAFTPRLRAIREEQLLEWPVRKGEPSAQMVEMMPHRYKVRPKKIMVTISNLISTWDFPGRKFLDDVETTPLPIANLWVQCPLSGILHSENDEDEQPCFGRNIAKSRVSARTC